MEEDEEGGRWKGMKREAEGRGMQREEDEKVGRWKRMKREADGRG